MTGPQSFRKLQPSCSTDTLQNLAERESCGSDSYLNSSENI